MAVPAEILIGTIAPWEQYCAQRVVVSKLVGDDPWFGEQFTALDTVKAAGDSETAETLWRQILERFWSTDFADLFAALGLPVERIELTKKDLVQLERYRRGSAA